MTAPKLTSGKCTDCGGWTGGGCRKLCTDCARRKPVIVACPHPGCGRKFDRVGNKKYCFEHRGIHSYVRAKS